MSENERDRRLEQMLDRIALGIEKLAADPEVEIEVGPPICPQCGKFNPEILLDPTESARGPMSEVVVTGTCVHCNAYIYIVIESYSVHRSRHTAITEIQEREKAGFFNNGNVRGVQREKAGETETRAGDV
jgi:hypothetical protein